ncbi:MAG TPA: FecR domain-containing protein [Sphingobium sp.]|uniref:FecR family protein n=1 Tax=Sphingobium sp. TaxID=1912891 RepID=UPI002ED4FE3E
MMGSETGNDIQARAIEWHVRLRHGDDATWEAFAEWMAEDPAHAEAYDHVEQADLAIEPLLPEILFHEAANDGEAEAETPAPARRWHRWGIAGGALAASIALAVALIPPLLSSRYDVTTGPGESRVIALDGSTQVILNGSTRMTFDHKDPRFAALASGEALFRVRHDAAHPFAVDVGAARIEDVGTVFNVVHDSGEVRVGVAEGEVVYNARDKATSLKAGQSLLDRTVSGTLRIARSPISAIGGWHKGRLVYSGEPLSQVATDLGRSLGLNITAASAIANRPFSGAITLHGKGVDQLRQIAPALDVRLRQTADGWVMEAADSANR